MSGKVSGIIGKSNELITLGLLLPHFPNAMLSSHELSSHDIIIPWSNDYYRTQVKTANPSISFVGGTRGGVDRNYDPSKNISKKYRYSTKDTDLIIGIKKCDFGIFELYFVPSIFLNWTKKQSMSTNKLEFTKNNFLFVENCKDENFIKKKFSRLL